jgi:hypothetical protein
MVMRSQTGSTPGGGVEVSVSQYRVVPVAEIICPRRVLGGEVFPTAVTESTKTQYTLSVPGKVNRSKSPAVTSPVEFRARITSVEPVEKLLTTTGCERRKRLATSESDQLPGERAEANA